MKASGLKFLSGMSSAMIGAVIATVVACALGTVKLEGARELPNDASRLDMDIQDSQARISQLVASPVLPPLKDTWREVKAFLQLNGLELKPDDGSSGDTQVYEGPLKHWAGTVEGDAKTVLAVMKRIQQSEPVYLLSYSTTDGLFRLSIAVVGI